MISSDANSDRARALAEGERFEHDYRIIRADGEVRWMCSRGTIVRRPNGSAVELYGVTVDITESKLAEDRVRATAPGWSQLVRDIPEYLKLSGPTGDIRFRRSPSVGSTFPMTSSSASGCRSPS
jgi:hypothetical protein